MNEIKEMIEAKFRALRLKDQASIAGGVVWTLLAGPLLTGIVLAYAYRKELVETTEVVKEKALFFITVEAIKSKLFSVWNVFKFFK